MKNKNTRIIFRVKDGVSPSAAVSAQPNPLQRLGIPITGDMLAKLLAVLGPIFTGPVVDFINFLLGKAAS